MKCSLIFRLTILFCVIFYTNIFAEPEIILSSVSSEMVKEQLTEIEKLKQLNYLDEESKSQLDKLWERASKIAELNDKCAEISLNETLNSECFDFYQKELPQFENDFLNLTGEIRLNGMNLSHNMENRREAIEACFNAFPLHSIDFPKLITLEGDVTPEPLSDGVEISYHFSFVRNESTIQALEHQLNIWYSTCNSIIFRTDNSGEFAPLFQERLAENIPENSLSFEVSKYNKVIYIKQKHDLNMAYILNKKQLFNNTISKNSTIGKIYFDNYDNSISLNIQYNFYENGKAIFTENEIRNGLRGKIHWDSPYKKNHLPKTNTASNFSDEDISSDEGISNTDSVYGFKFQFNTSLSIGLPYTIHDNFFDEYSIEDTDVARDSLNIPMLNFIGMLRYYGENVVFGIGGGLGIMWFNSAEEKINSYYADEYESYNIDCLVAPMFQIEFGLLSRKTIFELGVRYSLLLDPTMPANYIGGYGKLIDWIGLEIGYLGVGSKMIDGIYAGIFISLPPRIK